MGEPARQLPYLDSIGRPFHFDGTDLIGPLLCLHYYVTSGTAACKTCSAFVPIGEDERHAPVAQCGFCGGTEFYQGDCDD